MLSRKISYLILIVISVLFYILYVEKFSFYLMIFILSFPVAMLVILLFGKFFIKCTLTPVSTTSVKKSNCGFNLKIINKSIFPFPTAVIKIKYKNRLSDNSDTFKISVPIHSLASQTVTFNLSSEFCGVINAKVVHIRLFDYLMLFSCRIKSDSQADVYIIPDAAAEIIPNKPNKIHDETSTEFSKYKSGDDPSEIFELKDYVPGDKINRIHWNLSSKQNQLITKHYSLNIDSPVAVVSDILFDMKETNLIKIDTALEIIYKVSFTFLENQIRHYAYIKGIHEPFFISDFESLNNFYTALLDNPYKKTDVLLPDEIYSKSEIYLVTNKPYKNYEIIDYNSSAQIKYIFSGNYIEQSESKQTDNIKIHLLDAENFTALPSDIFF